MRHDMHNMHICEETFQNHTPALFHSLSLFFYLTLIHSFIRIFSETHVLFLFIRAMTALYLCWFVSDVSLCAEFQSTKVKANERMCVWFIHSFFCVCLFACHLNVRLKIKTNTFIRIHLRANINGNDRRDMHILMHTLKQKKTFLIHTTHSFAFFFASSFGRTFSGQFACSLHLIPSRSLCLSSSLCQV